MVEKIWPIHERQNKFRAALDLLAHKLKRVPGFCNICGSPTIFDTTEPNHRDRAICLRCGSRCRQRQIAHMLLSQIRLRETSQHKIHKKLAMFSSISDLIGNIVIWDAEANGALAKHLKNTLHDNCILSEFIDHQLESGATVNETLHVDMQKTHFADESIDFILTGDVLEHIPDYRLALQETYRILKNEGCHIFTVPFYHHRHTIECRATVGADNIITHMLPPWMHGDPVRPEQGILVYNVFAPELLCILEDIGFEASLYLVFSPLLGIYGQNGIVIVARKVSAPSFKRDWIFPS